MNQQHHSFPLSNLEKVTSGHLLLVFAVVPVVPLVLASQEVGPVVPLALHELYQMVGAVISLPQRQLRQVHLILAGDHL